MEVARYPSMVNYNVDIGFSLSQVGYFALSSNSQTTPSMIVIDLSNEQYLYSNFHFPTSIKSDQTGITCNFLPSHVFDLDGGLVAGSPTQYYVIGCTASSLTDNLQQLHYFYMSHSNAIFTSGTLSSFVIAYF